MMQSVSVVMSLKQQRKKTFNVLNAKRGLTYD